MSKMFGFGESIEGYGVPVLNERVARAAAGIFFLLAIVAFMNAWLMGNFASTRAVVVAFTVDFAIRVLVNPRFAPSLILGQWIVGGQTPEYTGAPQKRFAWGVGLALALVMFYLNVVRGTGGPLNLLICLACLVMLFFEAAFGICLGCKVYNAFNAEKAQLCPGGVCDVDAPRGPAVNVAQIAVLVGFVAAMGGLWTWGGAAASLSARPPKAESAAVEAERCKVPDFAKMIGHEAKWRQHNNCD